MKHVAFHSLKLGQRFLFQDSYHMVVELYARHKVAVNLETYKVTEIRSSENGVFIKDDEMVDGNLLLPR
jgi:hypothetical protein